MSTIFGKIIRGVSDAAVGVVDTTFSTIGAGGLIPDGAYSSNKSADAWTAVQDVTNSVKNTVLNAVAPGAGTLLGGLQSLNPSQRSSGSGTTAPATLPNTGTQTSVRNSTPTVSTATTANRRTSATGSNINTTYIIIGAIVLILLVLLIILLLK